MKCFIHYGHAGFGNCYILGQDDDAASDANANLAVVIDPGCMDSSLLDTIERHNYKLGAVLLTHSHSCHSYGLHALGRIYDFPMYAAQDMLYGVKANTVRDGDRFSVASFNFEVISISGHSPDSVVYKIENFLFTGDVLTAGLTGSTTSSYAEMKQAAALQNKLFNLIGNYFVFPGHGPPSSLAAERRFNAGISHFEKSHGKARRHHFNLELLE
jgi:glyoxylase-like metal-dependent hydrolase (beta-lactamase superfamily II)